MLKSCKHTAQVAASYRISNASNGPAPNGQKGLHHDGALLEMIRHTRVGETADLERNTASRCCPLMQRCSLYGPAGLLEGLV